MILLSRHGLTPVRKVPMESMQLNLSERDTTASITPVDMDGISLDNWMLDDEEPGYGIVYRVKSIAQNYGNRTPRVQLEHVIKQLGDRLIFGERGPAEITDTPGATTCTARQAIEYALARQSDWVLGQFDYGSVSGAYKYNGETILECIEKVSNTLQDCWWSYDFSEYPFRLNITQKSAALGTVLRANRNLTNVQKTIDRSGMVTRFYPIGKNDLHIGGDNYVDRNVDLYGVASRVETDESLDTVAELTAWATEYLQRHAEPIVTISVDAMELAAATGETLDQLKLGKKCRVMMEEFGAQIEETITAISYSDKVKSPEVARVTLANNRQDATKLIAEAVKQTRRSSRSAAYNNRKVCVGAEVNNNTLTLTFGDGSTVNFNKGGSGSASIDSLKMDGTALPEDTTPRLGMTERASGTGVADKTQGYTLTKALRSESGHSNMNFVELLEGTNNPIIVGRISTESVYDTGMRDQLGRMVPFAAPTSDSPYNDRFTTTSKITANGTYYACAQGYKSHYEGYDNANYGTDRYASARAFVVDVPTGGTTHNITYTANYSGLQTKAQLAYAMSIAESSIIELYGGSGNWYGLRVHCGTQNKYFSFRR